MINKKHVLKDLADSAASRGISLEKGEMILLLVAARDLDRWHTMLCNEAWHDEERDVYVHKNGHEIPDRGAKIMEKLEAFHKRTGLYYFIQTDPRGWPIYISDKPISNRSYSTEAVGISPHASTRGQW